LHKLSFPVFGFKVSSLSFFALKSLIKIFIFSTY
jgi:hypothetical protein